MQYSDISPATAALLALGVLSASPALEEYRTGELASGRVGAACETCRWRSEGESCMKRGEEIGSTKSVGCRDLLGVLDDRPGVEDEDFRVA